MATSLCATRTDSLDSGSIASSNASTAASSNLSGRASFITRFSWLTGTKASDDGPDQETLDILLEAKHNEILSCLNGGSEEKEVDLWHLRHLSLMPDGLISSSLRRRAWPKLMGAHRQVLLHASSSRNQGTKPFLEVDSADQRLLERDVRRSVWSIEDHVKRARQQNQGEQLFPISKRRGTVTSAAASPPSGPPPSLISSPSSPQERDGKTSGDPPIASINMQGEEEGRPLSPISTPSNPSFQSSRESTATATNRHEQEVLFNTVVSVLRTPPEDDRDVSVRANGDAKLHYFPGLHDLTALLLINLESPSLSSLVLSRLSSFHLRDAMIGDPEQFESAVRIALLPLLSVTDRPLHDHLHQIGAFEEDTVPAICAKWIRCWFCQDVTEASVASRLIDVFLSSHALMPLYLSAAVLSHPMNRTRIVDNKDLDSVLRVVKGLPADLTAEEEDGQEDFQWNVVSAFEDAIEVAVSYMRKFPPSDVVKLARSYQDGELIALLSAWGPSIAMFKHPPPSWAISSVAPTDWALLQEAKRMRKSQRKLERFVEAVPSLSDEVGALPSERLYWDAVEASGLGRSGARFGGSPGWAKRVVFFFVFVTGGLLCAISIGFFTGRKFSNHVANRRSHGPPGAADSKRGRKLPSSGQVDKAAAGPSEYERRRRNLPWDAKATKAAPTSLQKADKQTSGYEESPRTRRYFPWDTMEPTYAPDKPTVRDASSRTKPTNPLGRHAKVAKPTDCHMSDKAPVFMKREPSATEPKPVNENKPARPNRTDVSINKSNQPMHREETGGPSSQPENEPRPTLMIVKSFQNLIGNKTKPQKHQNKGVVPDSTQLENQHNPRIVRIVGKDFFRKLFRNVMHHNETGQPDSTQPENEYETKPRIFGKIGRRLRKLVPQKKRKLYKGSRNSGENY